MSDTVSVLKGDLDILVAAVTSWAPHDLPAEASDAFGRMLAAFDIAHADAPASEPAKVIVVERDGHPPRRFAATGWEVLTAGRDAGDLVLAVDGDEWVVQVGARNWDAVFHEDAELVDAPPSRPVKKLAIALEALREVADEPHPGYGPERAARALAAIAELGL